MSLGELLLPQVFLRTRPRLVVKPRRLPFQALSAPPRWLVGVDEVTPAIGESFAPGARLGAQDGAPVLAPAAVKLSAKRPLVDRPGQRGGWLLELEASAEVSKPAALEKLGGDAEPEALRARFEALGLVTFARKPRSLAGLLAGSPKAVVVNAADGEPLLSSQAQLLRERLDDVEAALEILSRAGDHVPVVLTVPRALQRLAQEAVSAHKVVGLGERYPEALDELAARSALGDQAEGPVLALSLETALAALTAVRQGRPTLERHLTVVAADHRQQRNVRVPLGTPLTTILEQLSLTVEPGDRVLSGGPLRGRAEDLATAAVDASTTAVVILPPTSTRPLANDPCVSCGACVDVCPMALQVHKLGRNAEFSLFEKNRALDVDACIGCGLCGYVCPSGRPLVQWIELTLAELAAIDAKVA